MTLILLSLISSILILKSLLVSQIDCSLDERTLLSDVAIDDKLSLDAPNMPLIGDEGQRVRRDLKRVRTLTARSDPLQYLTVVGDSCLLYYSTSLRVSIVWFNNVNVVFDSKPVADGSQCWSIDSVKRTQSRPAILRLYYGNQTVSLLLSITIQSPYGYKNSNGWWTASEGLAKFKYAGNELDFDLNVKHIVSENKFSYSGSKLLVKSSNNSFDNGLTQLLLTFTRFQLQPFASTASNVIFNDSFDAETWMTLPLWMGLMTLIVYVVVLYIGIYSLLQINTNDRFENPKGKPLIITNIDE